MAAASVGLAVAAPAATWHVAPEGDDTAGDGSAERPWRTLVKAVATAQPGDTAEARAGIYREAVVFPRSGTPEARITVRAQPGNEVILDGSVPVTNWTRCAPDEPGLTAAGVRHPHADSIFKTRVPRSLFGDGLILYEEGVRSRAAIWPDQPNGVGLDTDRLWELKDGAFGRNDRVPDPARTDTDLPGNPWPERTRGLSPEALAEYWRGASVTIWMRRNGNYTEFKGVTERESDALRLDSALRRALMSGDRYAIGGHPHAMDAPGEFYVDRGESAGDTVALYYWPRREAALADGIAAATLARGFYGLHQGYITIEGITVRRFRGEGIFFRAVAGTEGRNPVIRVLDCVVTDCGADGIYLQRSDDALVRGCRVERVGGRGIFMTGAERGAIEDNAVRESSGTCISFYSMRRSRIVGNRIYGAVGVHANGSSCYLGCRDILVARNIYFNGAIATFQNIRNFTLFANVWDAGGRAEALVAIWPNSRNHPQPTGGNLVFLHNTIINANRNIAAIFRFETVHFHNNLIGGSATWGAINHRSHNGWVAVFGNQNARSGWRLAEGEWALPPSTGLATIFRDALAADREARDYRLAGRSESNPAIHAGRDAREILRATGVLDTFPDFDFSVDLSGRPWAVRPSMGAYEFGD